MYVLRIVTGFCYRFTFEVFQIIGKIGSALTPYTDCHGSLDELDVLARDETSVRDPLVALISLPSTKRILTVLYHCPRGRQSPRQSILETDLALLSGIGFGGL